MREIFEAIDNAPPLAVLVVVMLVLYVLEALSFFLAKRAIAAHNYIQGYVYGYQDAHAGKIPSVRGVVDERVPAAFVRGMRR